jgi:hypothetical protein
MERSLLESIFLNRETKEIQSNRLGSQSQTPSEIKIHARIQYKML